MRGGQVDEFRKVFAARPEIVRADLRAYFNAGPSHHVAVDAPSGLALEIDGYAESSGYRGWYIAGTPIRINLADDDQGGSHIGSSTDGDVRVISSWNGLLATRQSASFSSRAIQDTRGAGDTSAFHGCALTQGAVSPRMAEPILLEQWRG